MTEESTTDEEIKIDPGKTHEHDDGAITYRIRWPKKAKDIEDKEIEYLKLERPNGEQVKKLGGANGDLGRIMAVAPLITAHSDRFFNRMDCQDYATLSEIIMDFIEPGPKTG